MRSTFALDELKFDRALLQWAQARDPQVRTFEDAVARGPGFNLGTLVGAGASGVSDVAVGALSAALENFGYWLFVSNGDPIAAHPPAFVPKCVRIIAARREITYDGRRALLAIGCATDPVLVPIPAVPAPLLLTGKATSFARSREALLAFSNDCVDRVNLVLGAALALDALVKSGYPDGSIESS